jgi:hypothetical protein
MVNKKKNTNYFIIFVEDIKVETRCPATPNNGKNINMTIISI